MKSFLKFSFFLFFMFSFLSGYSLSVGRAERLYQSSRRLLSRIKKADVDLSWDNLRRKVRKLKPQVKRRDYLNTLEWIRVLRENTESLASLYGIRGKISKETNLEWVRRDEGLLTASQAAFWRYAVDEWIRRYPEKKIPRVTSGYRSPAYQCVVMAQFPGTLKNVLKKVSLPGMSRHQLTMPDLSLSLRGFSSGDKKLFLRRIKKWGFFPSYPSNPLRIGELRFIGADRVYRNFFKSRRGLTLYRRVSAGLKSAKFFPHPLYLKAMLAIAVQESSFTWNPRLSDLKKKRIKEQFAFMFGKGETAMSLAFKLMVPPKRKVKLEQLKLDFNRLVSLKNRKVTEYDLQVWMNDFRVVLSDWLYQNRPVIRLANIFGSVSDITNRVAHEPQTFGLWQLNVNHFVERMQRRKGLARRFRSIYYFEKGKLKVNRDEWIACLCGTEDAALDRERSLDLIFEVIFRQRFENHYRGDLKGMKFFIAENLTGEMSTYRAALQSRLNRLLKINLSVDGDLAIYDAYRISPNLKKTSQTMKALKLYIRRFLSNKESDAYQTNKMNLLMYDLLSAETWKDLSRSILYQKVMGEEKGERLFPKIHSQLYHQSVENYVRRVTRILLNL